MALNDNYKPPVERGWQQMKQLLDREMPVSAQPKKRAVPLFWWRLSGVAALLLLCIGSWKLLQSLGRTGKHHPDLPLSEAAKPSTGTDYAASGSSRSVMGSENSSKNSTPNNTAAEKNNHALPKSEGRDLHRLPAARANFDVAPLRQMSYRHHTTLDSSLMFNESELSHRTEREVLGASERAAETKTTLLTSSLQLLPRASQSISPETVAFPIVPVEKLNTPQKKWRLGAATGMLSNGHLKTWGWSAALAMEYPVSEKWRLRTGLQYLSGRFSTQNTKALLIPPDNVAIFLANTSVPPSNGEPFYLPLSHWQAVEWPLQALFYPHRKWYWGGGVALCRNLHASTNFELVDQRTNTTTLTNLQQILQQNFMRWHGMGMISAGWHISSALEINAAMRFFLNPRWKNLQWHNAADTHFTDPQTTYDNDNFNSKTSNNQYLHIARHNSLPDWHIQLMYRW